MTEIDKLYEKIAIALQNQTLEIKAEIEQVKEQIQSESEYLRKRIDTVESRVENFEKIIIKHERLARRNNVIIYGLPVDEKGNLADSVINSLNKFLKLNLTVNDCNDIYSLSKKHNSPIKVEFLSNLKKKKVLKAKSNLIGSSIYINQDHCKSDYENSKELRRHIKRAKELGYKAVIKNGKLVVNGEEFSVDRLRKELDDDEPDNGVNEVGGESVIKNFVQDKTDGNLANLKGQPESKTVTRETPDSKFILERKMNGEDPGSIKRSKLGVNTRANKGKCNFGSGGMN